MPAERQDQIEITCDGLRLVIRKRPVHQWRTDLMVELDGKSFYLGRLEGGMTRREVKDLGRSWVLKHKGRGLKTQPAATRDTTMPSPGATRA